LTNEQVEFGPSTIVRAGISSDIKYQLGQDGAGESDDE